MGKSRPTGFTLIELLVALSVMAIVLAFAVPSFESFVNANRLTSAANEMMAAIQTARMEALRRNGRAVVCLSANPDASSPTCSTTNPTGWLTFVDTDKDGLYDVGETLLRTSAVKQRVVVQWSPAVAGKVIFRSDGLARDGTNTLLNGAIGVCIDTSRPAQNARHVCIGSGSRVSVKPLTSAGCSTAPTNTACD